MRRPRFLASRSLASLAALAFGWALPALALAAEEGEAGGHEAAGKVSTTVWGILIFATVLLILWKKAFPPITAALAKREQSIREALEAAERAQAESKALMAQHEASLEKARVEARAIIEEGKADAQRVKEGIVESARRESEELKTRALREIDLAKRSAVSALHKQAVQLSVEIASKVTHKALRAEDHEALIQESLRKYQEAR